MKDLSLHVLDIVQNSITAGARDIDISLVEQGGALTMRITDNGRGMSPELLAQVTDPFTTTRTTRKVGLGLPLLRMSAEMTGGDMAVESALGVGTTVTARFAVGHIDCPPVGDMPDSISTLVQAAPTVHFTYLHSRNGEAARMDTDELCAVLGEVPLDTPEVVLWLRDYLREQEEALPQPGGLPELEQTHHTIGIEGINRENFG